MPVAEVASIRELAREELERERGLGSFESIDETFTWAEAHKDSYIARQLNFKDQRSAAVAHWKAEIRQLYAECGYQTVRIKINQSEYKSIMVKKVDAKVIAKSDFTAPTLHTAVHIAGRLRELLKIVRGTGHAEETRLVKTALESMQEFVAMVREREG